MPRRRRVGTAVLVGVPTFWCLGCSTGYTNRSKRESGWRRSSPSKELDGEASQGGRRRDCSAAFGAELGDKSEQGFSGRLGGTARVLVALQSGTRGQGAQVVIGGKRIAEAADLPVASPGVNPAAAGDVAVDGGRGVAPGARAEFMRRISGARGLQGGGFTMAQGRSVRRSCAEAAARVWWRLWGRG